MELVSLLKKRSINYPHKLSIFTTRKQANGYILWDILIEIILPYYHVTPLEILYRKNVVKFRTT
jgi:hypothetical protein